MFRQQQPSANQMYRFLLVPSDYRLQLIQYPQARPPDGYAKFASAWSGVPDLIRERCQSDRAIWMALPAQIQNALLPATSDLDRICDAKPAVITIFLTYLSAPRGR